MSTSTTQLEVASRPLSVEIGATTAIATSPEVVWRALTDFDAYPSWNPFVRRISGPLAVGGRLEVELAPNGRKATSLRPTVVEVEPGRSFTWLGRVGVPGVLDGRHRFTVEAAAGGTRLVQHEVLSGALVPLFRSMLTRDTPAAFVASNDALAARVLAWD